MSQITSICPKIVIGETSTNVVRNGTFYMKFICPKLKGEFEIQCWYQNLHTKSKFSCWNQNEARKCHTPDYTQKLNSYQHSNIKISDCMLPKGDMYLMIAATNHDDWIVFVRCSAKEENRPAEGMSWAIFSKKVPLEDDVADVLFGLLDGYGFDVNEYKTNLMYNDCPPWVDP